jgi:hypothetical protein
MFRIYHRRTDWLRVCRALGIEPAMGEDEQGEWVEFDLPDDDLALRLIQDLIRRHTSTDPIRAN